MPKVGPAAVPAAQARRESRLCPHMNCPTAHNALPRTLQGETFASARESALRVGLMLGQHHLPAREKGQMAKKQILFQILYTVRKSHLRHLLFAQCNYGQHATWQPPTSEHSANRTREARFLGDRFSPPLRFDLPRRKRDTSGRMSSRLCRVVAPVL